MAQGPLIQYGSIKFIHTCSQYLLNTNSKTVAVVSKKNTNIVPVTIVK